MTYLCTSRNGQYTRKYTVKIRFVYAEPSQSLLKTFRFPAGVNSLTKDSEGRIDQTAHTVHITARYAGERPKKLIPEFSATGEVTVDGLTQSSGFSAQDFEYPVYYKVTDPDDPQTYTIYAVTVHFEYSADSGCELTEFKLLMQDNPSLTQDVDAFTNLETALQKANELPDGVTAEIWMSKDCTLNNKRYELKRTLTLRGGFLGIETEADQRNKDNKTVFRRNAVFFSDEAIRGTLTFDGIQFGHDDDWGTIKPIYDIKWDTAGENVLVIENCTVHWATDFNTSISSRLASVTIKDSEASAAIRLPKCNTVTVQNVNIDSEDLSVICDTAAVDNYSGRWLYINSYYGTESPAQKVVIKNSRCNLKISAKDIDVSRSRIYGEYHNFDVISLYRLSGYNNMALSPAASASIKMKNCDFGNISIKNDKSEALKLKNVDITAVTIADLSVSSGKVITERLSCSKGWYNDDTIGSLKLPACSITMTSYKCTDTIDVSCNAKDFKAIMEAVPVHTDIAEVEAKTLKCGYITDTFRTIKREYSCSPYVLKEGYRNIFNEPVPFASAGSHSLKDVKAENLYVSSGNSITLKGGSGYQPFRLEGQLKGSLSFFCRWSEEKQANIVYNAWDFSSVVLNNETTPNSKIDIDNIYVQGEWFRAWTNTLSARNILPVWLQLGCVELQGHSSVTAADCNFRDLVPSYAYYDNKDHPTIYPSLLAIGGTVSLTGCTFDESFVQVGSGTCFGTHLNSMYNCTAAVWKK